MKKLVALLMSLVMVMSMSAVAFATEVPTVVFDESTVTVESGWWEFEDGYKVCIPSSWAETEVSEENAASGVYHAMAGEEGSVTMMYGETEGKTMADFATELGTQEGMMQAGVITLNGMEAVAFDCVVEEGVYTSGVAIMLGDYFFTIIAGGASANEEVLNNILFSVSPLA